MSLYFLRSVILYFYHIGCLSVIQFFLVEDKLYCVCSRIFFQPWYRWLSLLHIELVHNSAFILTSSQYRNIYQ